MSGTERIGVRMSATLRQRLAAAGEYAPVARALLILGLHTAGHDVTPLRDEAAAALGGVRDAAIRDALLRLLVNSGSTAGEPLFTRSSPAVQPAFNVGSTSGEPVFNLGSTSGEPVFNLGSPTAQAEGSAALVTPVQSVESAPLNLLGDDPFANVGIAV